MIWKPTGDVRLLPKRLRRTTRACKYLERIPKAVTLLVDLRISVFKISLEKKRLPEREITNYPCFISNEVKRKQLGEIGPS